MSVKQIFNTSAELDYPKVLPTLDLDFANTKALDPRITFTRASGGSYVGADGLIKYAGVNEPRFDHDPVTGESLGFLVEESRTNLITYSQAFNSTNYSVGYDGGNFIENATAAPDGTLTASKLIRNAGASGAFWGKYERQNIPVVSGTVYTISLYLKAAEISTVYISGDLRDGGGLPYSATFTLTGNGAITNNSGTSAQIVNAGNGWYRCSITGASDATVTEEPGLLVLGPGTSGQGLFAWGFQLEAGDFPTSYIPTEASTRTRAADNASITGDNFSSWYNKSESTAFITSRNSYNQSLGGHNGAGFGFYRGGFFQGGWAFSHGRDRHVNFSNGYGAEWRSLFPYVIRDTGEWFSLKAHNSNTFPIITDSATTFITGAMSIDSQSFIVSSKGYKSELHTLNIIMPNVGGLAFRVDPNFSPYSAFSGTIRKFTYYPKRLPDAQLQVLTR